MGGLSLSRAQHIRYCFYGVLFYPEHNRSPIVSCHILIYRETYRILNKIIIFYALLDYLFVSEFTFILTQITTMDMVESHQSRDESESWMEYSLSFDIWIAIKFYDGVYRQFLQSKIAASVTTYPFEKKSKYNLEKK